MLTDEQKARINRQDHYGYGRLGFYVSAAWSASPVVSYARLHRLQFVHEHAVTFFRLKLNWILDGAEIPPVLAAPTWRHA